METQQSPSGSQVCCTHHFGHMAHAAGWHEYAHTPLVHALGAPPVSAVLGAVALLGPGRKLLASGVTSLVRWAQCQGLHTCTCAWRLLCESRHTSADSGPGPGADVAGVLCRGHPDMNSLIGLGAATSFLAGGASLLLPEVNSVSQHTAWGVLHGCHL